MLSPVATFSLCTVSILPTASKVSDATGPASSLDLTVEKPPSFSPRSAIFAKSSPRVRDDSNVVDTCVLVVQVLFPLGDLTKPQVRDLATKAGLPVAQKRESMGVCFVGKRRSWADFISQYITPSPGTRSLEQFNFLASASRPLVGCTL